MGRRVGTSFQFIESPDAQSCVLEWFRRLPSLPEETVTTNGMVYYFRQFGPLVLQEDGSLDAERSPVVRLVLPRVRREILWTVGEVHFLSALTKVENRAIQKVARSFSLWLKDNPLVYDQSLQAENPLAYYLEGGCKNWGNIYALASGLDALEAGRYFVSDRDTEPRLDTLCRALRLRGVVCG